MFDSLQNLDKINLKNNIHITFSGGGLKGYHNAGIFPIFNNYIDTSKIKSISCCSIGSITGVFCVCNIDIKTAYKLYQDMQKYYYNGNINPIEYYYDKFFKILPDNAHELCNKYNLEICVSKITLFGLKKIMCSNFKSKNELIDYMCASITPTKKKNETKIH